MKLEMSVTIHFGRDISLLVIGSLATHRRSIKDDGFSSYSFHIYGPGSLLCHEAVLRMLMDLETI